MTIAAPLQKCRFGRKRKTTPIRRFVKTAALACMLGCVFVMPAFADDYFGKIDLVAVKTDTGTRFFVKSKSLSLFATGEFRDAMLQGFYRKVNMSIAFKVVTPCPGGITGTCGNVFFVTIDSTGF